MLCLLAVLGGLAAARMSRASEPVSVSAMRYCAKADARSFTSRSAAAASCLIGSSGRTAGRRALAHGRGRTQRLPFASHSRFAHQGTCISHDPTAEAVRLPHRDQPSNARCRHLSTWFGYVDCIGLRQCDARQRDTRQLTGAGAGDACAAIGQRGSRPRRTLRRAILWACAAGQIVRHLGGRRVRNTRPTWRGITILSTRILRDTLRQIGFEPSISGKISRRDIAYGPNRPTNGPGWLDSPGHCENIMDPPVR